MMTVKKTIIPVKEDRARRRQNAGKGAAHVLAARLLLASTASALACQAAQAQSLDFNGLRDLPGGSFKSGALGVSDDGSVVVGIGDSPNGTEAFRWTRSGGMIGLGDLPGGLVYSSAFDVSGDGSVVVGWSLSANGREAFRWTQPGGMVGLGDLPGGVFASYAFGASADGSVVTGMSGSANGLEAFRWTQSGGMVGLGDLPGGIFFSVAFDISADGSTVVGYSSVDGSAPGSSASEAFRWTASSGMEGLGDLPGGLYASRANGVSADGSVVVGMGNSPNGVEAFRWTQSTGMVGLGDLPGAVFRSEAFDISDDGSVVVGSSVSAIGDEAFLWTQDTGMQNIRQLLIEDGVDMTGWILDTARSVSSDGSVIVGVGENPSGDMEGWIAVLGAALVTPDSMMQSAASLNGVTEQLAGGLGDAGANLTDIAWNGACSSRPGSTFDRRWCAFGAAQGSVMAGAGDAASGSFAGGIAWPGTQGFRAGLGPVYAAGRTDLAGEGSSQSLGVGVGGFVAYGDPFEGPQFTVSAAWMALQADIDRAYLNGADSVISSGKTDGYGLGGEFQLGWRLPFKDRHSITPYANLALSHVKLDGYSETTGPLPAVIDDIDRTTAVLRLGLEGRFQASDDHEITGSIAWGEVVDYEGSGISGNLPGLFSFFAADQAHNGDFVEASMRLGWQAKDFDMAATIGGRISSDADNGNVYARLTIVR